MPVEITMPQLSDTMSEGTLVKWHKQPGDTVSAGDVIAEVETDKANMDMEAFEGGTIAVVDAEEGQTVKVGQRIAVLATADEDLEQVKKQFASGAKPKKASAEQPKPKPEAEPDHAAKAAGQADRTEAAATGDAGMTASKPDMQAKREEGRDRARRQTTTPSAKTDDLAHKAATFMAEQRAKEGVPGGTVAVLEAPARGGNGRGGGRLRISPLARRIAEEKGIDLSQVQGTGPNGRIVQRDVLEVSEKVGAPARPEQPAARAAAPQRAIGGQKETIQLSKMRAVIAQRLQQSKQQIPHFYETIDIDMEDLARLRERLNQQLEKQQVRISVADLIARAVAVALGMHPGLNATFDGSEITRWTDVNLGIAVALDEGLIVPVLRGVNQMGLREIRQRSADLIDRARQQKLKQDEMRGATFTISNLGTYGIREFSAIINPPEVAILAVGAAEKRAVVRGGQIIARSTMTVTLSADHRVVDGAAAADFLRTLKSLLEEPGMMLI
jgi:pyruvate dehydrogenase E2 component (dihydrolipoamide acetyltransferase)